MIQIFNLTPDLKQKAYAVIAGMEKDAIAAAPFTTPIFKAFIVKDGTQDAEDRKQSPETLLGPVEYEGRQYLIFTK